MVPDNTLCAHPLPTLMEDSKRHLYSSQQQQEYQIVIRNNKKVELFYDKLNKIAFHSRTVTKMVT